MDMCISTLWVGNTCRFIMISMWSLPGRDGWRPTRVNWTFSGWTGTRKTVDRARRRPCLRPPWNQNSTVWWWPARCWAYSIHSTGTGPSVSSPRASRTRLDDRPTVPVPSARSPGTPRPELRGRRTTSPVPRGPGSRGRIHTRTGLCTRRKGCCLTDSGRSSPNRLSGCPSSGLVSGFLVVYTWLKQWIVHTLTNIYTPTAT